jgi:hypothetical protein
MIFILYKALFGTLMCWAFWHWFLQPQIKYLVADYRKLKQLLKDLDDGKDETG